MAKVRPRGREEVVEALLASARRLIAERGPSVPLRDIAEDADVSFGLLHHYLGTKAEVLDTVYRAAAESAASRLAAAPHLDEAVEQLMRLGDGTTTRLIAWAVLEGRGSAAAFEGSPALDVLRALMRADTVAAGSDLTDDDARVFAAFVMTVALGWHLFGETALLAAGVRQPSPEAHREQMAEYMRRLAKEITTA